MQLAAFLCVICVICGRITRKRTQSICTEETPIYLPLISQIYADKTTKPQNSINLTTSPTCLSLRNNAACCIPLCVICAICGRIHARVLKLFPQMKPQSLPQISQIYADKTPKQQQLQQLQQPQTTCLSLRDNAACCIPLRHLRYLRENNTQEYSINLHKNNKSHADLWSPD